MFLYQEKLTCLQLGSETVSAKANGNMIGLDYLSLSQISGAVINFPISIPAGKQEISALPVEDPIVNVFLNF